MMKKVFLTVALCLCMAATDAWAQKKNDTQESETVSRYTEQLTQMAEKYRTDLDSLSRAAMADSDAIADNPAMYPLFAPMALYASPINWAFGYNMSINSPLSSKKPGDTYGYKFSAKEQEVGKSISRLLLHIYGNYPTKIKITEGDIKSAQTLDGDQFLRDQPFLSATEGAKIHYNVAPIENDTKAILKKPNYWKSNGSFKLKWTQNYISDNWYQGGENSHNFLGQFEFHLNYNDNKKISYENHLYYNLGAYTSPSDTCHRLKTNTDQIKYNTKIGYKAAKNLYYTINLTVSTQSMAFYETNKTKFRSNFMAPFDANFSAGIDFKPQIKNISSLSIYFAPLSAYNYRFVRYGYLTSRYGIRQGRHHKEDFGTRIDVNMNRWTVMKNMYLKSTFYFYTDYSRCEGQWENTLSFSFNKYFSSDICYLMRFDDNRGPRYYHDRYGYLQVKEYMTMGLTYSW